MARLPVALPPSAVGKLLLVTAFYSPANEVLQLSVLLHAFLLATTVPRYTEHQALSDPATVSDFCSVAVYCLKHGCGGMRERRIAATFALIYPRVSGIAESTSRDL